MTPTTTVTARTVLVADDTAFVRDRFQAALEGAGHRAITVRTGPELLSRVKAEQLDLVVLDLRLPQGQGVNLLRSMRRIDQEKPPVIIFSGTIASASEVRDLAALGVVGYVNEYTAIQHILPSLAPHLFPEHYNRRSSPRVTLGIPVSYRFGNTIATALTLNVSRGGLSVRTTSTLDVGTAVRVRFRLPGSKKDVEADARIAWTDRRFGMGVEFTRIDPASQATIDDFVHSHFFSNRKA